jgi:uncharacterized protein YqeY
MTLYQTLKDEQLAKRKSAAANPINKAMALTLGTVLAEATRNTKEPTDDEVLKALRKVRAGIEELQSHAFTEERANEEWYLSQWIPQTLDIDQTGDAVINLGMEVNLRNMKAIRAELDAKFPGQIDGGLLARVVKEWPSNV